MHRVHTAVVRAWAVALAAAACGGAWPGARAETLQALLDGDPPTLASDDGSIVLSNFTYDGPGADLIDIRPAPVDGAVRFVISGVNGVSEREIIEVLNDTDLSAALTFTATAAGRKFGRVTLSMAALATGVEPGKGGDITSTVTVQEFVRPAGRDDAAAAGQVFVDAEGVGVDETMIQLDPDVYGSSIDLQTQIGLNTVVEGSAAISMLVFDLVTSGINPPPGGGGGGGGGGGNDNEAGNDNGEEEPSLVEIRVNPSQFTLCFGGAAEQLQVTAIFDDGGTADISSGLTGTRYVSDDLTVVTVSEDGRVTAGQEGAAVITVLNAAFFATAEVTVDFSCGPPDEPDPCAEDRSLSALAFTVDNVALDAGSTLPLQLVGLDCAGRSVVGLQVSPNTAFTSSDNAVATVSARGLLTAVAEGVATIAATNDQQRAELAVEVLPVDVPPPTPGPGNDNGLDGRNAAPRVIGECTFCGAAGLADLLLIGLGLTGAHFGLRRRPPRP